MQRALGYYHAALWSAGAWTVKEQAPAVEQLDRLLAFAEAPDETDLE